ncbi:ATPase, T2SS/T4P/T4SS family [Pseudomonas sp. FP833]|uniref:ATPase, T2SS/T4P/T4SS family n=1 Tax=Pseudomonas sp. FP833 TaxID=2954102 RepID=UPI002732CF22|nr:ATPase, T2SS/T4P/T4SS family [Pseudomonas sp. FP833]WLI52197.1 ATPase, T2SS/T4P/T4SS family [Pseudomonas sp. FP833]
MTNLSTEAVDLHPADSPVAPLPVVVLTAPGGPHPIKEDLRQILALTADGKLFISPQHLSDPFVMSFMDQLDHKEIEFEVVHASMSEIKALYQTSASTDLKKLAETQRQAQVVEFMGDAHRRGASDIHIVVSHDITRIKYRLYGVLKEVRQEKSNVGREFCAALYNSMCDVSGDYYKPHISQDARVSRKFVNELGLYGARVATRPLVEGPMMIMRLLYDDTSKTTFEALGFLPVQIQDFKRLRSLPFGLNLITGPTGSGKSKSLQVNLNELYDETGGTRHILTLEDPPEYPLKANQSPIYPGETWNEAITGIGVWIPMC